MQRSTLVLLLVSASLGCTKTTQKHEVAFVASADSGVDFTSDAAAHHDAAPIGSDAAALLDAGPNTPDSAMQDAASVAPAQDSGTSLPPSDVLRVDGRYLYDTCGNKLLIRGFEQLIAKGIDVGGSWDTLIDEIAKTGANAVRILPAGGVTPQEIDGVIARIVSHGMVFNISRTGSQTWFEDAAIKAVLSKYEPWMMLDAFHEPNYDDRPRWVTDVKASIQAARAAGYRVPLNVIANHYGRDLPSVLNRGAELVDSDPLHSVILGWQAYWGSNTGSLAPQYGQTVVEGVANAAAKSFVVQLGIDYYTDPEIAPSQLLDYAAVMQAADTHELGWLWWDWYNPFGKLNNATNDGTAANLTARGDVIVNTSPYGIKNTSHLACTPTM